MTNCGTITSLTQCYTNLFKNLREFCSFVYMIYDHLVIESSECCVLDPKWVNTVYDLRIAVLSLYVKVS